ncbi:hypothetical protein R0K18_25265, partial [Pantoea sp. SIMBA_133]
MSKTTSPYKKYTILDMKRLAEERGGKCLSDTYVNNYTKLKWECTNGHQFEKDPRHITSENQWCVERTKYKYTLDSMKSIA